MILRRTLLLAAALLALSAATVSAQTSIGWGNLQWPNGVADPACEGGLGFYGQVWLDGVTNAPGQGAGITAELGFGPVGSTPDGTWLWIPADYNVDVGNNDEYVVWATFYLPFGFYDFTFRYHYDGDPDWYYAAERGSAEFTAACGAVGAETMTWSALKQAY